MCPGHSAMVADSENKAFLFVIMGRKGWALPGETGRSSLLITGSVRGGCVLDVLLCGGGQRREQRLQAGGAVRAGQAGGSVRAL